MPLTDYFLSTDMSQAVFLLCCINPGLSLCSTRGPQSWRTFFCHQAVRQIDNTAGLFHFKKVKCLYRILLFTHEIKTLLGCIYVPVFFSTLQRLGRTFSAETSDLSLVQINSLLCIFKYYHFSICSMLEWMRGINICQIH